MSLPCIDDFHCLHFACSQMARDIIQECVFSKNKCRTPMLCLTLFACHKTQEMKVINSFYRILDTIHFLQAFLFIGNIKQQLLHLGVSLTKLINNTALVVGKKTEYNQSAIKMQSIQKPKRDILFLFLFLFFAVFCFFIRVFYHTPSHLTGQQGKREGHSFSVLFPLKNI